jgi:hypothetical protein
VTFGAYREDGVTVRAPQQTATAPAGLAADVLDAAAELLDGRAVLDLLRAEDRVHLADGVRGLPAVYR